MKKGFSLIELMFVLAIMGIMMAGTIQLMMYQQKIERGAELSINWLQTTINMFLTLSTPASCTAAIGGQPFLVGGNQSITYTDQYGFVLTSGTTYMNLLMNTVEIDAGAPISATQFNAKVYVNATKQQPGQFIGVPTVFKSFPVKVNVAGGNTVASCF